MRKMKSSMSRRFLWIAMSVLCFVISAAAQTETARIQGNITDQAGAAVPGATVTVTDLGTNREVSAVTNEEGAFTLLALQPGRYRVSVAQSNFKTTKQEVTLEVAQNATLDFSLEPGAVTETVTVTSDAPLVETSTSAIGGVIQGRQIVELPLNGRNVLELARLTPGVTQGVTGGFATGAGGDAETYRGGNTGGAALSVNGQRTQANNFLLDGVDNNESLVNTINIFPAADATQEFRVQTSVATAEFGRGGGAIINSVVKSGTNDFHGSSYLFIRNSAFDARPAFFNSLGAERRTPLFRRSQFGATVGGPVIIPGFGEGTPIYHNLKDKVFFFFSYDGLRQFLPRATEMATVPTAAFRNGDFSQLLNPASSGLGAPILLRDPATGAIIPGNRIDLNLPGRINQAALNYLRAFPLPNNGSQVLNNFINTRNEIDKQDVFDWRVDANINDSNQMFVRMNYGRYSQTVTSRLPTLPSGFGSGSNPTRTKAAVLGLNTSITPTLFNEFRIQANRLRYGYEPPFGDQAISANLGIVNANRDSSLGGGALIGGYNGQLEYTGDYGPYRVPQNTYQLVDSLSWVKGDHTVKFGGTLLRRNVQLFRPIAGKGYFFLYGNGDATQCGGGPGNEGGTTRFEQADLLVGFVCRYDIGFQNGLVGTTNWENGVFAQDDWKISRKLTLNLGMRYEYFTNPAEEYARQANFDLTTGHLVLASDSSDTLTNTDKNNFSPRFGFAYDIFGDSRSVIRGGYGIFYFLDRGGINNQLAQNPPFSGNLSFSYGNGYRITLSGQGPLNSTNNTLATQPLPLPAVNLSPAFLNNPLNASVLAVLPDNKTSNVQQFNIQFQQALTNDTVISAAYVGTRGRNLIVYYNLNGTALTADTSTPCPIAGRTLGSCYPGLGSVNVRDDAGRSQYDSLQIQLERRFSKGWQYIASYTFSTTQDNGEGAFDKTANGGLNYIERYSTSKLDYPHVFTFATVYEIPFGRGRSYGSDIPKALDLLVGGWQINSIVRAQSGNPFDVRVNDRLVNVTGDPYTGSGGAYLNRSAFTPVATGLGNLARNSLRSPSNYQVNLGILKNFSFNERARLQFRAEAFNLTNRTQLGTPNTDYNNVGGFGVINTIAPYSNRQLQFGLRLEF
ncbi:MAG: TonB-dependent receptor [Pyrinomonadaceae bacterium]